MAGCVTHSASPLKAPRSAHHVISYDGSRLTIDGRITPLWAASFHYWRLPDPTGWSAVFHRLKNAGYNAVALDFFWGYHSPRPGAYDFSDVRDVDDLLGRAAQAKLFVIGQPGPYIGNQAEGGGFPDWIFARNPASKGANQRYEGEVRQWLGW